MYFQLIGSENKREVNIPVEKKGDQSRAFILTLEIDDLLCQRGGRLIPPGKRPQHAHFGAGHFARIQVLPKKALVLSAKLNRYYYRMRT